jgi:hypothetical protein
VQEARTAILDATRQQPAPKQPASEQEPAPDADRDAAAPQESESDRQRVESLRAAVTARHSAELKEQELRHAREVETLQENQQAAADKAILSFSQEQARRTIAERPQEPGGFEKLWRSIRETVDEEARRQRLADEAERARDAEDRRSDEVRIMVSGLNAAQRQEIDALVDRQAKERADLLDGHARDLKRRTEDEQRAIALEREYEQRRRDALSREREGPERDPRAR